MKSEEKNPPESSSTDTKALQEITKELEGALPPWSKAKAYDRLRLVYLYIGIYVPVVFVVFIQLSVFVLFVLFYIVPLVGSYEGSAAIWYWHSDSEHTQARIRGWVLLGLMIGILLILNTSFVKAVATDPGRIPKTAEWVLAYESEESSESLQDMLERRKDGNVRHCLRCSRRKPDRCHHCRLCERCVLKMDHHCPWIANCVGYENYKYFFLVVVYSTLALLIFAGTFWETVVIYVNDQTQPVGLCLFLLTSYTLVCMLALALFGFLSFHSYLLYNDLTTIEFCEKRRTGVYDRSMYRVTCCFTLREIFGASVWAWPCPIRKDHLENRPLGSSGLSFATNTA